VKRHRAASVSAALAAALALACGGGDPARQAVMDFTRALADSSYGDAWDLLTPGSQQWYDSTVVILHVFGWTEARESAVELAGEMTGEEFAGLTGRELFVRMAESSPEVHNLSSTIKSVNYPVDSLAVVVLRTSEGLQEVVIREIGGTWLIDLASLGPPVEGE
jgi:hypothetical protein